MVIPPCASLFIMLFIHSNRHCFDIVTPIGPKDVEHLENQIEYTKRNVVGYRNIYIVPHDPGIELDGCITIPESLFPFSIEDVIHYHGKQRRNGWYLQQLLKLYVGFLVPEMLDRYLVVDSDTYFLRPTNFIHDGKPLFNPGTRCQNPDFVHMRKMHPSLEKLYDLSGISHHMMFEQKYIKELFDLVENYHKKEFWKVFLEKVEHPNWQGASEYEIYFHYMLNNHRQDIKIRFLNWKNARDLSSHREYDYISCHWHLR